jgi:predicted nucleotidyltransferase
MPDILSKLFGSAARVKLLRLFLFNSKQAFALAEAATRTQTREEEARRELALFEQIQLIKQDKRARALGTRFVLNNDFKYIAALQNLLLNAPELGAELYERVRRTGTLKLVVVCGVFMGEWDAPLDVLIVGDKVNERMLRDRVRKLEAEVGKEIRYALLTSESFFYRINMNDHLIKDVFDYPHRIVHDKLQIGLK